MLDWGGSGGGRARVACFVVLELLSGQSLRRQESKPPRLPAGVGSTRTLCRLRKAVRNEASAKWRSAGGVMAEQAQTEIVTGGRWFPGTPVAEHLACRGPPGARRPKLPRERPARPRSAVAKHWRDEAAPPAPRLPRPRRERASECAKRGALEVQGALGAPRTLESERRVGMRVSRGAFVVH